MFLDPSIEQKNNREYNVFCFVIGPSIVMGAFTKHKSRKNKDD